MDTQNSSDEDDNNQSIVNDAEDNVSNVDCTRGRNEDKEQEEGITLSLAKNQEDLAAAKKHTQHGQTAKIPSQQSETRPAVKRTGSYREVDQSHQPGAEGDSETNRSHGQSQEAATGPIEHELVSQPASTAWTLRSGRDTQKGRSQSQSSIVDSFRRMKSSDRTKDNQARRGVPIGQDRTGQIRTGQDRTGLQVQCLQQIGHRPSPR